MFRLAKIVGGLGLGGCTGYLENNRQKTVGERKNMHKDPIGFTINMVEIGAHAVLGSALGHTMATTVCLKTTLISCGFLFSVLGNSATQSQIGVLNNNLSTQINGLNNKLLAQQSQIGELNNKLNDKNTIHLQIGDLNDASLIQSEIYSILANS